MKVLVINCGSSSIKYQVVEADTGRRLLGGTIERLHPPGTVDGAAPNGKTHEAALAEVLLAVGDHAIDAVGHRVVHGGDIHAASIIDDALIARVEACSGFAPLHNPANIAGILAARKALPDVPHVAVFDTALHARLPRRARTYALDPDITDGRGIRRHGFHGTSHAFVASLAAAELLRPLTELRLITLHLGNGASACAMEFGHSVETSMGMTPLEGLVMGTRSGDVDPGVVLSLAREIGVDATERLLNEASGLAGLSGLGNDLRDIETAAAEGNDRARLAIAVFAHRVRKTIGAYAAAMGGVDAVVLTAGIGENAVTMRRRILQRLEFLGLILDEERNQDARVSDDRPVAPIHAAHSRVEALVIATNEELMIARQTASLIAGGARVQTQRPIPIAISARHLHLDRATMDALFGEGAELSPLREISQPGQFAAEQKVALIGPRGRIDGVRVLGPLRPRTQVEVSRTDEFRLGVDAPIRGSGQVEGSAPIVLEGPRGRVELSEGLICARRHIHMTPDDAATYGVADGDEVEVAIENGPRDLIFGDVLIRVKSSYRLEMHIDTDEANAAELSSGALGEMVYRTPDGAARALLRQKRPHISTETGTATYAKTVDR